MNPSDLVLYISKRWSKQSFSAFLLQKPLKMTISTNVWRAQYPNAGRNMQQPCVLYAYACQPHPLHMLTFALSNIYRTRPDHILSIKKLKISKSNDTL